MQYHYFQNYTITSYTYQAFKIEGKEMYLIFVLAKCCWSVHSLLVRLGKHAHSKQGKTIPTQNLQFHVKFMYMPYSFTIYRVNFSTYNLVWSKIRNSLDAEKAENWLKYTNFTELKKIEFTRTVRFILFLFSSLLNFVDFDFV